MSRAVIAGLDPAIDLSTSGFLTDARVKDTHDGTGQDVAPLSWLFEN
jgi:hypothetical protein